MKLLSSKYQELLKKKHATTPNWGLGNMAGPNYDMVSRIIKKSGARTVLNYGCGKAKATFDNVVMTNYDPGIEKYSLLDDTKHWDLCISLDVLEHIEPVFLDDNLKFIHDHCEQAFLLIATRKAGHLLPDGTNAHLIIEDEDWWKNTLSEYFDILEEFPLKYKAFAVHVLSI